MNEGGTTPLELEIPDGALTHGSSRSRNHALAVRIPWGFAELFRRDVRPISGKRPLPSGSADLQSALSPAGSRLGHRSHLTKWKRSKGPNKLPAKVCRFRFGARELNVSLRLLVGLAAPMAVRRMGNPPSLASPCQMWSVVMYYNKSQWHASRGLPARPPASQGHPKRIPAGTSPLRAVAAIRACARKAAIRLRYGSGETSRGVFNLLQTPVCSYELMSGLILPARLCHRNIVAANWRLQVTKQGHPSALMWTIRVGPLMPAEQQPSCAVPAVRSGWRRVQPADQRPRGPAYSANKNRRSSRVKLWAKRSSPRTSSARAAFCFCKARIFCSMLSFMTSR